MQPGIDYDIFTLGFNKFLSKGSSVLESSIQQVLDDLPLPSIMGSGFVEIPPSQIGSGEIGGNLTMIAGLFKSANYVSGSAGWSINYDGSAEFSDITLYGGTVKYGKTSFTDSTNAGYWIGSLGFYIGGASDVTKLKYTIADGTLDFIGRLLNSAGAAILNSSAQTILKDFTFSPTDYSGAFKSGDIVWNVSTGAIESGSGIILYKKGIVGAASGVATFSIDATTGSATFAGTLSAAIGTLGTLEILTTGHIRGGQTAYNTGEGFFLGYDTDAYKLSIGNSADTSKLLLWDGVDVIVNDTKLFAQPIYGDGSDGSVTISSNTTLTSDKFYNNLTINSGITLNPAGYRIFVRGNLTIDGIISRNGNNGADGVIDVSSGAGGAALATNTIGGSGKGGDGGNSPENGGNSNPGKGGNGGNGGSDARPGEGDNCSVLSNKGIVTLPTVGINAFPFCIMLTNFPATDKILAGAGGGGGQAYAYFTKGPGGGGGSGGGVIFIAAKKIIFNGSIEVKGGNGGAGKTSGGYVGGSGGGGGGGFIVLIYNSKTGSGTTSSIGGTQGGGNGCPGGNGSAGNILELQF